jgi:hypothetical protein
MYNNRIHCVIFLMMKKTMYNNHIHCVIFLIFSKLDFLQVMTACVLHCHSTCPSGKNGGSLGSFGPGQMLPQFDDVVFRTGRIGQVCKPIFAIGNAPTTPL